MTINIKVDDKIRIIQDSVRAGGSDYIFEYIWDFSDGVDRGKFLDKFHSEWKFKDRICKCGSYLSYSYIYIIESLKETELLPESYNMMCCFCHILACIGLEIPKEWKDINMTNNGNTEDDDYSSLEITGIYTPTDKYFELIIRIHDAKKALNTGRILNDIKI